MLLRKNRTKRNSWEIENLICNFFLATASNIKIVDNLKNVPKDKVLIFKKQKDLNKWLKEFTHNENILAEIK